MEVVAMALEMAPEMVLEMVEVKTEAVLQTLPPRPKILATELPLLPSSQWAQWLSPRTLSRNSFMDLQL
jgi:hypothetical protein